MRPLARPLRASHLAAICRQRKRATHPIPQRFLKHHSTKSNDPIAALLSSNKSWAKATSEANPDFFTKLSKGQAPKILWIGCADSRCPETTILGLQPGDVFVHRNIANILHPTDLSSLSVIEFAINALKVERVVVCGHTSCGGVAAGLANNKIGKIDTWLLPLRSLRMKHAEELEKLPESERGNRMAELNVRNSVEVLLENPDVMQATKKGLTVHGLIFDLASGQLKVVDTSEDEGSAKKRRGAFETA